MGRFSVIFAILDDFTQISVASGLEDNIFVGDVWRNPDQMVGVSFVTIAFLLVFVINMYCFLLNVS